MAIKPDCIFLIGFMGAGKTTFGKKLANKLQFTFLDLDEEIARRQNAESVQQLIDKNGFYWFRAVESETLISTGGGTPCHFDNLEWMKRRGKVIFLDVDEGILLSRLKTTNLHERPLLKDLDEEGLKNFIHDKLEERLPIYRQADIIFDPVKQKIEELVAALNAS